MRWAKRLSIAFLLVVSLLLIAIAGLVGTRTGLHFMINSATRLVPGLEIADISGGWRDLTLQGIKYKISGVDVNADKIHLSLRLSVLLSQ